MENKPPKYVGDLTPEEIANFDTISRYRGVYIEHIVRIENLLNTVIYYFFDGEHRENVSIFLKY